MKRYTNSKDVYGTDAPNVNPIGEEKYLDPK